MDEWFKARNAWAGAFETLSDAEAGRLAKALWKYTTTGEEAELSGNEKGCFAMILWTLHMDEAERNNTSAIRRLAGLASAEKRKATKSASVDFVDTNEQNQQTATKPTEKNKIKNKKEIYITTTTNSAREEETPFGTVTVDPLIVKIQAELNGLTDTHYQRLEDFRQFLGDDLVSFAIDAAVGNGVRNWAYVEAILNGYEKDGIKTVGEAKARAEKRNRDKPHRDSPGKVLNAQKFDQREYTEDELKSGSDDQILAEIMKARQGTA